MLDLIIRDVTIYDGTGAPPRRGDIAVEGDTINAVGATKAPACSIPSPKPSRSAKPRRPAC
jgi:N-acyl-D-amino-acid deacylase